MLLASAFRGLLSTMAPTRERKERLKVVQLGLELEPREEPEPEPESRPEHHVVSPQQRHHHHVESNRQLSRAQSSRSPAC